MIHDNLLMIGIYFFGPLCAICFEFQFLWHYLFHILKMKFVIEVILIIYNFKDTLSTHFLKDYILSFF